MYKSNGMHESSIKIQEYIETSLHLEQTHVLTYIPVDMRSTAVRIQRVKIRHVLPISHCLTAGATNCP